MVFVLLWLDYSLCLLCCGFSNQKHTSHERRQVFSFSCRSSVAHINKEEDPLSNYVFGDSFSCDIIGVDGDVA